MFVSKIIAAGAIALAIPGVAQAHITQHHRHEYVREYHQARNKFGASAVGCNLIERKGSCHLKVSDAKVSTSIAVLDRMLHPAVVQTYTSTTVTPSISSTSTTSDDTASYGGSYSDVPGVPASFAACVAERESSDGAGSSDIYGIIPASGVDVEGDSLAAQKAAFAKMYAEDGTSPWSPYDGC